MTMMRPKSRLWPKDLSEKDVRRVLRELTKEYDVEQEWERAAQMDLPKQLLDAYEEAHLTLVCNHSKPDATVYVQIRSDEVRLFAKYKGHKLAHYYHAPVQVDESKVIRRRNYAADVKTAYETWRCPAKRKLFV